MFKKGNLKYFPALAIGAFLGLLTALFFLNLIQYLAAEELSPEIDLIAFFSANIERRFEAGAIVIILVFLGAVFGSLIIAYDNIKRIKRRMGFLEELDKTRTEFIWMASHQLRTPLSALKWSINMILAGSYGELNKEQQDILTETCVANEKLIILIDELLDVAQLETRRLKINLRTLSLSEFQKTIERTAKELKILADKENLLLTFESSLPLLLQAKVKADISKIQQVVQSLIENAIWYTLPKRSIKVKIGIVKNEVMVQIVDEGIGIPEKEQSKIFNKFFRASNALRIRSAGTGLGLYLCKIFLEGHGGKIGFVSQENKGSTFSFSLPLEIEKSLEGALQKL